MFLRFFFISVMTLTFSFSFSLHGGKTWVSVCNDGQNIQYNQTENGVGYLYMKVLDNEGNKHIYQVAKLKQTFFNGTAICGTVLGNGLGAEETGGLPITQVCMNRNRKIIYVKYKHPYDSSKTMESGRFCQADVSLR